MKLIDTSKNPAEYLETSELTELQLKALSHPLAKKVIELLTQRQSVLSVAKKLKLHEQTLYYLVHKLVKAKILIPQIDENGNKFYISSSDSYFVKLKELEPGTTVKQKNSHFLESFIENNSFNAKIIVGSPDPHGPNLARSRDGYFGMDLAVFLGTFITTFPGNVVKLDTEVTDKDLQENLIIIGGPVVNQISSRMKKPRAQWDMQKRVFVIGKKTYIDEDIGIISREKSPFNNDKYILYVAGIRNYGTRAAIQGFIKHFEDFEKYAQKHKEFCIVVRGEDLDSDGVVDNASIIGVHY